MARNAERANAVLNKWLAVKAAVTKGDDPASIIIPRDVNECMDVKQAQKWRAQLLREIGKGIALVQDASVGEHRIRDINDEINRKLRTKRRWEYRIKELGGPDYLSSSDAMSLSGIAAAGGEYYYFGAAKELPGVRELFAAKASEVNQPRKTRAALFKRIKPDYFGWRDEEHYELIEVERIAEKKLRDELQKENMQKRTALDQVLRIRSSDSTQQQNTAAAASSKAASKQSTKETENRFRSYVDLPTNEEINALLIQRRKDILLQKYTVPKEVESSK